MYETLQMTNCGLQVTIDMFCITSVDEMPVGTTAGTTTDEIRFFSLYFENGLLVVSFHKGGQHHKLVSELSKSDTRSALEEAIEFAKENNIKNIPMGQGSYPFRNILKEFNFKFDGFQKSWSLAL